MAGTIVNVFLDHDDQVLSHDNSVAVSNSPDRRLIGVDDAWRLSFMGTPAEIVTGVDHLIEALHEIRTSALTEAARKAAKAAG